MVGEFDASKYLKTWIRTTSFNLIVVEFKTSEVERIHNLSMGVEGGGEKHSFTATMSNYAFAASD